APNCPISPKVHHSLTRTPMARHLGFCVEAFDPIEGHLLAFFPLFSIGALLLYMARTKRPGLGPSSPPPDDSTSPKRTGE
ncbi:unnamed protein product, partial [Ilex paraguariensis]